MKENKKITKVTIIILIVSFVFAIFVSFFGKINVEFDKDYLKLSSTFVYSSKINCTDISNIEYKENINLGVRTMGIGNFVISAGDFKNDEFGKYKLYANSSCKEYIIIYTKEKTYVFNEKDSTQTQELYKKIKSALYNE